MPTRIPDDLKKIPTDKLIEQINRLLAELKGRADGKESRQTVIEHDGCDVDGDADGQRRKAK